MSALAAIPGMLPNDHNLKREAFDAMREVLSASADITGERARRFKRIAELFGLEGEGDSTSNVAPFDPQARAS
jgi:hypothetical protein